MLSLEKKHNKIIEALDFTGGQRSFFDFWHIHYDFNGKGNKSLETRIEYIKEGIRIYEILKFKLQEYPHSYQIWIGIDENESGDDGVYIHTPNPNSDYFPHLFENSLFKSTKNQDLMGFLNKSGFEIIESSNLDSNYYVLYKNGIGVDLRK